MNNNNYIHSGQIDTRVKISTITLNLSLLYI